MKRYQRESQSVQALQEESAVQDHGAAVVQLLGVSKFYEKSPQRVVALRDVNVSLERGDRVVVTGTSGSGKSTLLHMIGTLDRPSCGTVVVSGSDVTSMSDHAVSLFRNSAVGFVFQMNNLLPEFDALENVMMPALIAGAAARVARERARRLLTSVSLQSREHHKPSQLSGGEQQRVAIARALVMNPQLLLADEPTGNLDQETSVHIENLLKNICDEFHTTMVLVTHDERLASQFSKKIMMEDGRIKEKIGFAS